MASIVEETQNICILREILNFVTLLAEKRSGQRAAGDLADLQTHQALQEDRTLESEDTSAEVPSCHLRVSYISYLDRRFLIVSKVSLRNRCLNQEFSNNS